MPKMDAKNHRIPTPFPTLLNCVMTSVNKDSVIVLWLQGGTLPLKHVSYDSL